MSFPCVEKYLNETWLRYLFKKCSHQTQNETLQQAEECLRFLSLSFLSCGSVPISQKIDDLWHLLILETEAYNSLCASLPGQRFIHHTSDDFHKPQLELSLSEKGRRHLEWLVNYARCFGSLQEHNIIYWPFALAIKEKLGLDFSSFHLKLLALTKTLPLSEEKRVE